MHTEVRRKKKKLLKIIDEHSTLELFLFLDARRQCRPRSRRGRRFVSQRLTFPLQQQPCWVTFSLRSEGHFFFLVCFPFVDITFGSAADVAGGTYTCITPGFLVHSRCRMDAPFFVHTVQFVFTKGLSAVKKSHVHRMLVSYWSDRWEGKIMEDQLIFYPAALDLGRRTAYTCTS